MKLNKTFKHSFTAMTIATAIFSTVVTAAPRNVPVTEQIKGRMPTLENVIAEGTLQVGKDLFIPDAYVKDAVIGDVVKDEDLDTPLTLKALQDLVNTPNGAVFAKDANVEWFLIPKEYDPASLGFANKLNETEFIAEKSRLEEEGTPIVMLDSLKGQLSIKIPTIALKKRIGFKVTTRTESGFPIDGEPVYVMNAFVSKDEGPVDPIDPVDPDNPPGTIDPLPSLLIVETRASDSDDWIIVYSEYDQQPEDAPTDYDYSKVNQQFRANLVDENGASLDYLYQNTNAFTWRFSAKEGQLYDGKALTASDLAKPEFQALLTFTNQEKNGYKFEGDQDYFYFNLQDINDSSKVKPLIEQGLNLNVVIDDEAIDVNAVNPAVSANVSPIAAE